MILARYKVPLVKPLTIAFLMVIILSFCLELLAPLGPLPVVYIPSKNMLSRARSIRPLPDLLLQRARTRACCTCVFLRDEPFPACWPISWALGRHYADILICHVGTERIWWRRPKRPPCPLNLYPIALLVSRLPLVPTHRTTVSRRLLERPCR